LGRGHRWKPPYWFICNFVYFVDEMGLLRVSNFFTVSTVLPHQIFIRNVTGLRGILATPVCCVLAGLRNGSSPRQCANQESRCTVYCSNLSVLSFRLVPIYSVSLVTPLYRFVSACLIRSTCMRLWPWFHLITWRLAGRAGNTRL
jgi:hypothetical protein